MEPIHHVYYYTTTFGSKISDAVYIASLDGYERDEIFNNTARRIYTTFFFLHSFIVTILYFISFGKIALA